MFNKLILMLIAYIFGIFSAFIGIGLMIEFRIREALNEPQSHILNK